MIIKSKIRNILCIGLVVSLAACGGAEERKSKYMEKGKAYFEQNNFDKARVEFKNVLQIDTKFPEAYYYVGQLEEKEQNIGKAIGNYSKAIELDPKYVAPKVNLAKIYVVVGTEEYLNKARALLSEVLAAEPDNSVARLVSATIEYKTGAKESAQKEIEKVVASDPTLVEGISLLALIYIDQGQDLKALQMLENGVSNNKKSIPLKISLAKMYSQRGESEKAEQQLLEVIQLEPDNYSFRVALFTLYGSTGKMDEAEQVLRQAIEDDKEDARRYLVLVEFLSKNKSIGAAESELKDAIQKHPSMMDLRFALAEFYRKINDPAKAKQVLNEIVEKKEFDKDEIKATIQLASMAFDEKQYDTAKQYADKVLQEYPTNNDALLIRGKLALVNRDADTAVNDLRTVFKNEPKNADAAMLLATAHELAGQKTLAEDVLKKAIENNPVNSQTHYNYARYLLKEKRGDEATGVVNKALDYFKESYELMELKLALVAQKGDEKEVLAVLNRMKMAFPDKADAYLKKGQYYMNKREFDKAREEFEQALEKSANKYQPLESIVNSYLAEKDAAGAIERVNAHLSKSDNDAMSYQLLGKIYYVEKDQEKARQNFQLAIGAQKNWVVPYMSMATTYIATNELPKAEEMYQQAIANAANAGPARLQLAMLYEKQGKFKEAIAQYREIIKIEPGNLVVANNLASLLLETSPSAEDIQTALDLTRDFVNQQQPALLDTLGWVYVKAARYPEAVTLLRKVVEMAPDVAVFKYHLGVALKMDGKEEEGKKYLMEAVNSSQKFIGKEEASKLLGS